MAYEDKDWDEKVEEERGRVMKTFMDDIIAHTTAAHPPTAFDPVIQENRQLFLHKVCLILIIHQQHYLHLISAHPVHILNDGHTGRCQWLWK